MEKSTRKPSLLRRILNGIGLSVFGVLVAWLLIEIGIRVFFDSLPPGVQGDIQHVQRVPWSDEKLIPEMPFILDRDFQARLPVGLKNQFVHWGDSMFHFDTIAAWDGHRAGLRSDPPRWPLQILTFGDSFTFCWTEVKDCWVRQLQDRNDWHVFDAGIPGTGSSGQLALMKEIAPPFKPKLIVWQWFNNDISDNYDLARARDETPELPTGVFGDPVPPATGLSKYSAVAAMLKANIEKARAASATNAKPTLYVNVTLNNRVMSVHTANTPYPSGLMYPNNQYGMMRDLKNKAEAAALAQSLNAKLLIVLIPAKEEAYADLLKGVLSPEYIAQIGESRRKILDECTAQGWLCVDALPTLQKAVNNGQTVYYQFDAHLDPVGNKILADLVEATIKEKGLLN